MKILIKKIDMTGSIDRQWTVVVHAVRVRLPTSTKLRVLHSAKKINHRQQFTMENHATGRRVFGFSQHNYEERSAIDVSNILSNVYLQR